MVSRRPSVVRRMSTGSAEAVLTGLDIDPPDVEEEDSLLEGVVTGGAEEHKHTHQPEQQQDQQLPRSATAPTSLLSSYGDSTTKLRKPDLYGRLAGDGGAEDGENDGELQDDDNAKDGEGVGVRAAADYAAGLRAAMPPTSLRRSSFASKSSAMSFRSAARVDSDSNNEDGGDDDEFLRDVMDTIDTAIDESNLHQVGVDTSGLEARAVLAAEAALRAAASASEEAAAARGDEGGGPPSLDELVRGVREIGGGSGGPNKEREPPARYDPELMMKVISVDADANAEANDWGAMRNYGTGSRGSLDYGGDACDGRSKGSAGAVDLPEFISIFATDDHPATGGRCRRLAKFTTVALTAVAGAAAVGALLRAQNSPAGVRLEPPASPADEHSARTETDIAVDGQIALPPAPMDLPELCSPEAITTAEGYDECYQECIKGQCCFVDADLYPSLSCRWEGNEEECEFYQRGCEDMDDVTASSDLSEYSQRR